MVVVGWLCQSLPLLLPEGGGWWSCWSLTVGGGGHHHCCHCCLTTLEGGGWDDSGGSCCLIGRGWGLLLLLSLDNTGRWWSHQSSMLGVGAGWDDTGSGVVIALVEGGGVG